MSVDPEVIVRARDVSKVYRLYRKPHYRFLDMFGLLRKPDSFTEHRAVDGISLEIRRGQRVAIIGRNGAGKSTFLKLVTRVIEPTTGSLEVQGKVHALLQVGTGFHPDFTGRENVYAYFAQLGVTGADADRRFEEVVDFAEIEEYIDQPLKTYSTGMGVRLMFSTSTAISPDLLVLDEVLGVGDAYFAHKSFGRMKELCEAVGSTLLLVTHDVYSAVSLCERVIWIDHGRVLIDGPGPTVVKAYEDSVRQQEESRLRVRKQRMLEKASREAADARGRAHVLLEIQSRGNKPQPSPVYFSALELVDGDRVVASLPLGDDAFDRQQESHLQREATCWGDAVTWEGRPARPFLNFGSSFHKIAGVFALPEALPDRPLSVRAQYWMAQPCELSARAFVNGRGFSLGVLTPSVRGWTTQDLPLAAGAGTDLSFSSDGVQGTGAIVVDDVKMVDDNGHETTVARHGEPVHFVFDYRVADPQLRERAQFVVIFHRDGVQIASRVITRDLMFEGASRPRGRVHLRIPSLALADGAYAVSVFVAREGYFDQAQTVFYSLNPGVYYSLNRVLEMTVTGSGLISSGAIFVDRGEWSLQAVDEPPLKR